MALLAAAAAGIAEIIELAEVGAAVGETVAAASETAAVASETAAAATEAAAASAAEETTLFTVSEGATEVAGENLASEAAESLGADTAIDISEEEINLNELGTGLRQRLNAIGSSAVNPTTGLISEDALSLAEQGEIESYLSEQAANVPAASRAAWYRYVLGGLGLTGSVGYGILYSQLHNNGGVTLPGTDYVGPGNNINIDAPRHGADAIAKEHDLEYARIEQAYANGEIDSQEFYEAVQAADSRAANGFRDDFQKSGMWQSKVGELGLSAKQGVEKITGVIYPKGQKRPPQDSSVGDEASAPKQPRTDSTPKPPTKGQKDWKRIQQINKQRRFNKNAVEAAQKAEAEYAAEQQNLANQQKESGEPSNKRSRTDENVESSEPSTSSTMLPHPRQSGSSSGEPSNQDEPMDTSAANTDATTTGARAGHGGGGR